jgi:hypothetical protein
MEVTTRQPSELYRDRCQATLKSNIRKEASFAEVARQVDALLELAVGHAQEQASASTHTSSSPSALTGSFGQGWQGLVELLRHAAMAQTKLNALVDRQQLHALNDMLGPGKQAEITYGTLKGVYWVIEKAFTDTQGKSVGKLQADPGAWTCEKATDYARALVGFHDCADAIWAIANVEVHLDGVVEDKGMP